jgi:hypothetical protein
MPRYAIYETQTIRVVYFVEADNPEQAYIMVDGLGITEYDDLFEVIGNDIDEERTLIQTPDGWDMVYNEAEQSKIKGEKYA